MTHSEPTHVHLRLRQDLLDQLDDLRCQYPTLRTRAARVEFALHRGLTALAAESRREPEPSDRIGR